MNEAEEKLRRAVGAALLRELDRIDSEKATFTCFGDEPSGMDFARWEGMQRVIRAVRRALRGLRP